MNAISGMQVKMMSMVKFSMMVSQLVFHLLEELRSPFYQYEHKCKVCQYEVLYGYLTRILPESNPFAF